MFSKAARTIVPPRPWLIRTKTGFRVLHKLLILITALVLVPHARAATAPPLNLVVAIDLTKSVAVKGTDGKTEFQKNVDGVTRLLAQVPANTHVTVLGITGHSFANPYPALGCDPERSRLDANDI